MLLDDTTPVTPEVAPAAPEVTPEAAPVETAQESVD